MILNNTQANIFKVNGGIANNFANRPAASGSFYIFYSLDTQEIWYDSATGWILLGMGGGGTPVNIYTSDGIILTDRNVDGNNKNLQFANNRTISFLGADPNQKFYFNLYSTNFPASFVELFVENQNTNINYGLSIENFPTLNQNRIFLGKTPQNPNTGILYNVQTDVISTIHQTNIKGIRLEYQSQRYQFGHITSNGLTLQIENATSILQVLCNPVQSGGSSNGIFLDLTNNRNYLFGQFNGGSQTHLRVSDLNSQITTNFSGSINGINLRQSSHTFGFISGTNTNTLRFNSNLTVGFYYNNLLNGLNIQHESTISGLERYDFGKLYGASGTQYKITLTDLSCFLNYKNIAQWGLTATQAEFGFTPGSGSNILLDSSGNINLRQLTQILINGTGITQGTSGSVSGQHLKVKINNVDYVIELRNP